MKLTNSQLLKVDSEDYISDKALLIFLLNERKNKLRNIYAPMYQRLSKLQNKIQNLLPNNIKPPQD